jgi:F0F1-type ATP synthase membrane subunit b/b'
MTRHKPFSQTEMKMLVYNKVKQGRSYDQACKQLKKEIDAIIKNSKIKHEGEKKAVKDEFKEEFEKLKNGKKR